MIYRIEHFKKKYEKIIELHVVHISRQMQSE